MSKTFYLGDLPLEVSPDASDEDLLLYDFKWHLTPFSLVETLKAQKELYLESFSYLQHQRRRVLVSQKINEITNNYRINSADLTKGSLRPKEVRIALQLSQGETLFPDSVLIPRFELMHSDMNFFYSDMYKLWRLASAYSSLTTGSKILSTLLGWQPAKSYRMFSQCCTSYSISDVVWSYYVLERVKKTTDPQGIFNSVQISIPCPDVDEFKDLGQFFHNLYTNRLCSCLKGM